MGKRPCRRRATRLAAGALLALQISFIALASDGNAATGTANSPVAVVMVPPVAAGPPAPRAVGGMYDVGVLETAKRYTRDLYRRATALREATAAHGALVWAAETVGETRAQERLSDAQLQEGLTRQEELRRTQAQGLSGAQEGLGGAQEGLSGARAREGAERRLPSVRLAHTQAAQRLKQAGLGWKSSGGCTNRRVGQCTSLEAVRTATVDRVIDLKRRSGCPVVITGGTEVGHAPGPYSHHEGYKLDIRPNRCISGYIKREYPYQRVRGDGAPLYGDSETVYARESNHWDILFR